MTYLDAELSGTLSEASLFEDAMSLQGEIFREVESRRTLKFRSGSRSYFAKLHFGVGWAEIFKNLFQFRLPVLGAENELLAIKKLKDLGIDTLTPVAFVSEGGNPAKVRSCIITKALENTKSLEEMAEQDAINDRLRRKLVIKIAQIARNMHEHGINHRDFYICHFLMEKDSVPDENDVPMLFLIDLHRAQVRSKTPKRWRVKDVSGLLFSGIDAGVTRTDLFRFMKVYSGKTLRKTMTEGKPLGELLLWDCIATVIGGVLCLLIVAYHGQLFGVGVAF